MSKLALKDNRSDIVTDDEWNLLDPAIKDEATKIVFSIKEAHEKIAEAKQLAKEAPNKKGGVLGARKQKNINAVFSESLVKTNEAAADLTDLIKFTIGLVLQSAKTASNMQKALAYLAVKGISDANGRIETLSIGMKESIYEIIDSAKAFVQQFEEQDQMLKAQSAKDKKQDQELERMDRELQLITANIAQTELKLSEFRKLIDSNQSNHEHILTEFQKLKRFFIISSSFTCVIAILALIFSMILRFS